MPPDDMSYKSFLFHPEMKPKPSSSETSESLVKNLPKPRFETILAAEKKFSLHREITYRKLKSRLGLPLGEKGGVEGVDELLSSASLDEDDRASYEAILICKRGFDMSDGGKEKDKEQGYYILSNVSDAGQLGKKSGNKDGKDKGQGRDNEAGASQKAVKKGAKASSLKPLVPSRVDVVRGQEIPQDLLPPSKKD